jgi:acetyl-CoA C-acetyltransferase
MAATTPLQLPRRIAVVGGARIPFCRSGTAYRDVGNREMMLAAVRALVAKYRLDGERLGDVILGAVMTQPTDWNLAREVVLASGLAPETPGFDLRRACGTGLEAASLVGMKIAVGNIEVGIAGGCDTISDIPVGFQPRFAHRLIQSSRAKRLGDRLKAWAGFRPRELKPVVPGISEPTTGLSMGQHTDRMAREWGVPRAEQDQLALESHRKAAAAYQRGFYHDLVYPYLGVTQDNNVRADTSLEKLAKLAPAYYPDGTLTAGNSSPLTDGASCALLASEDWAKARGLPVQAYLTEFEAAAINLKQEGLLMAPSYAVPRMLARAGIGLGDFDFYEIHEAFAAQVLCTLRAWESEKFCRERLGLARPLGAIDRGKLNVVGGSVALGHPFGATGARILATLAKLLVEKGAGRGLLSVCTAGGMGVTAILERP